MIVPLLPTDVWKRLGLSLMPIKIHEQHSLLREIRRYASFHNFSPIVSYKDKRRCLVLRVGEIINQAIVHTRVDVPRSLRL